MRPLQILSSRPVFIEKFIENFNSSPKYVDYNFFSRRDPVCSKVDSGRPCPTEPVTLSTSNPAVWGQI